MSCCRTSSTQSASTTACSCPLGSARVPVTAGLFTAAWYALPDVVGSRLARGIIKTAGLGATAAWMWHSHKDLVGTRDDDTCHGPDRDVSAAGATEFEVDEAIGVDPGEREVLGTLRDRETFERGGTCGCGGSGRSGDKPAGGCCKGKKGAGQGAHKKRSGGCCQDKQDKAAADTDSSSSGSCCKERKADASAPSREGRCRCPLPQVARVPALVGALITLGLLEEKGHYYFAEYLKRRGVPAAHTLQGIVCGVIQGAILYSTDWHRD